MQISLQSTGHAKSLAKTLCRALAKDGRSIKLTAAQDAVARMFGHPDHRALCAGAGKGAPAPYDDEIDPEAVRTRREAFATRLADALGIAPAKGAALVAAIGPLTRDWRGQDDWRARRQAHFARRPLGDLDDRIDLAAHDCETAVSIRPDPETYGPQADKIEVIFVREKTASDVGYGIEHVCARIAAGDRALGWLLGVAADVGGAKTRSDLSRVAGLLDGPFASRAMELFERRVAQEVTIPISEPFGRIFVVTALVRNPQATPRGAGAALFSEAAAAVAARYREPVSLILNATPTQYDFAPTLPSFGISEGDQRALRSTGRAAAGRRLRDFMLGLSSSFPQFVRADGIIVQNDVTAFDLDFPHRCSMPTTRAGGHAIGSNHPLDEAGDAYHAYFEDAVRDRKAARGLFGDDPDPAPAALSIENAAPSGFDLREASAPGRVVRPHPDLWARMPKDVVRIEIERTAEEHQWARVRRALMDRATMRDEVLRAAKGGSGPRLLPDGRSDTVSFVFENGTVASVPERHFAAGYMADVIGAAFTEAHGYPLRRNPYTDEMPIGDLWSVLTSNVLLLYSGGDSIPFREERRDGPSEVRFLVDGTVRIASRDALSGLPEKPRPATGRIVLRRP